MPAYDYQHQINAHSDLARNLCTGEVDTLTEAELGLLNQALETAAIAAATARSIMDVARARFRNPWDDATLVDLKAAAEAHGVAGATDGRVYADVRRDLKAANPSGSWLPRRPR